MTTSRNGSGRCRRTILGGIATAAGTSLAGCLDDIPFIGDDPLEFSSETASIPEAALNEAGYAEVEVDDLVIEETVEAAGQSQEVIVRNRLAEYDKGIDLSPFDLPVEDELQAAIVAVISTPQMSVLGQTFNPVGEMDAADLIGLVQDRYDGLGSLEEVETDSVTIRDSTTSVTEFEGNAAVSDAEVPLDLTLHVAEPIESADDLLVAIGGYPTATREMERDVVFDLFEAIDHPS